MSGSVGRKKEMERVEEGAKSRKIGGRCGKQNTASDATFSPAYQQTGPLPLSLGYWQPTTRRRTKSHTSRRHVNEL